MKIPLLGSLLLLAIRAYKRYLSPYKGYSCAYRVHTGCASCSTLGYRAIRRYGVPGVAVLRERLARCGDVHRRHHPPRPVNYQAGECDPGCDGLDCGSGGSGGKGRTLADCACDAADCLDWGRSGKKRRRTESRRS